MSGPKARGRKTNEIKAIPELIDCLNIKGTIVTTDAMGTQTAIVKKIRKKRADYVLALKANQEIYWKMSNYIKKGMGGTEDHPPDTQYVNGSQWRKTSGRKIFYK